jgi:hypothetical protein
MSVFFTPGAPWHSRGAVRAFAAGVALLSLVARSAAAQAAVKHQVMVVEGHGIFEYAANSSGASTTGFGGGFLAAFNRGVFNGSFDRFGEKGASSTALSYAAGIGFGPYRSGKSGVGTAILAGLRMPTGSGQSFMTISYAGWFGSRLGPMIETGYVLPKGGGDGSIYVKGGIGFRLLQR